ncbi:hypothetical protein [Flavobacterium circumlabens]|nr:hypothetical protein [Flavobacterium circumlabens]TCN53843.1 hypothetical protein EV142_108148 [Flavobacterium circumlabens]
MKISKTIFFVFFITLISVSSVTAGTNAPPKPVMAKSAATPKPPGVPIDQSLTFLIMAALLFGTYTLYQYNLKRKASV